MRLQQLYYFKALAEKEHLINTATELYISPPALSTAITRLEEELGLSLFERAGRNIRLNEDGKKFYVAITGILTDLEAVCAELKKDKMEASRNLIVGTSNNLTYTSLFADFIRNNPHIVFNNKVIENGQLFQHSAEDSIDFFITPLTDLPLDQYEYSVLIPNDGPVLIVYDGHRFCNREEIALQEVRNEPFIALPKGHTMRVYMDRLCGLAGFKANVVAETDIRLRTKLITDKLGITLSTEFSVRSLPTEGVHYIKVTTPVCPRTQVIAWPKGRTFTPQAEIFLSFVQNYFKRMKSLPEVAHLFLLSD